MKFTPKFCTVPGDPYAGISFTKRSSKIVNPNGSVIAEAENVIAPADWSQISIDVLAQKYFRRAGVPDHTVPVIEENIPEWLQRCVPANEAEFGGEHDARQVFDRLAGCWTYWGWKAGYFDSEAEAHIYHDEMRAMLARQIAAPNSPQWFNTGLHWAYGITGPAQGHWYVDYKTHKLKEAVDAYTHPAPFACYINEVKDNLIGPNGIMDLVDREARIFKFGGGAGTNFSKLRGAGEPLSGGGKSSGLMSWLRILDRAAGAIKSGGTTRRAAKMVILDADHPDIEEFITWKSKEEQKVADLVAGSITFQKKINAVMAAANDQSVAAADRLLPTRNEGLANAMRDALAYGLPQGSLQQALDLARQGTLAIEIEQYDVEWNNESYTTVSGQNSNNSVRIPNAFLEALERNEVWNLTRRVDGQITKSIPATQLWDQIALSAWKCADPGLQFSDTINDWHTCPNLGEIVASNPCVAKDTLVSTKDGLQRIIDLTQKTTSIVGADGKMHRIARAFKTGEKPVFKLTTKSGFTIKVTGDHKIATANRGDVKAQDLRKDDSVILSPPAFGKLSIHQKLGELIGLVVGDGCVSKYSRQTSATIVMSRDELPILSDMATWLNQEKKRIPTQGPGNRRKINAITDKNIARVAFSTPHVLRDIFTFATVDEGSQAKKFNDAIFHLDKKSVAAILRGLFTSDGTVANYGDKSQYVALDSSSLKLLRQVQLLLLGFGIKAKIYNDRRNGATSTILPDGRGGHKSYDIVEMHSLRVSKFSRILFEKEIGFHDVSKKKFALQKLNKSVSTYSEPMTDAFLSLEPLGIEPVYDLTEPATHHFVANGLLVHNCAEYLWTNDSSCNLASLNLVKFLNTENLDDEFDIEGFEAAARLWTLTLEISVVMGQLPSQAIALNTFRQRTLGLGFANLGTLLMRIGLPYDSENGRNWAAAISALMTGISYRTSAEVAAIAGAFADYPDNANHMMRVIRNHRHAANNAYRHQYEDLSVTPVTYAPIATNALIWDAARAAWEDAERLGKEHGFRNAQTVVIAPTGTIGLLLGCDTTGVEPDFALVKFKKLAGGGYFKIVNDSVKPALRRLGYNDEAMNRVITYALGTGIFSTDDRGILANAGLDAIAIDAIEKSLPTAMNLDMAAALNEIDLSAIPKATLDAISNRVCGTMTLEGAPDLEESDIAVFDCATPCGITGTRFIAPRAHIDMLAAVQPFVSGSISKTINVPQTSTIEDVKDLYRYAHGKMVKCVALYRDGSKLSQPLSGAYALTPDDSLSGTVAVAEKIVYRYLAEKRSMPGRAGGYRQKFSIGGHTVYLNTGEYQDGTLGEIFLSTAKEGAAFKALLNNFAIAISIGLQHGVPLEEFVEKFAFTKFEPNGPLIGHDRLKTCTSIIDAIFRDLAISYLDRDDLAHVQIDIAPTNVASETFKPVVPEARVRIASESVAPHLTAQTIAKAKGYTGNACSECGQLTMVRNGACEKCDSCGATSGCS